MKTNHQKQIINVLLLAVVTLSVVVSVKLIIHDVKKLSQNSTATNSQNYLFEIIK